jgi:DNA-binding transcriptional LysR family regulator
MATQRSAPGGKGRPRKGTSRRASKPTPSKGKPTAQPRPKRTPNPSPQTPPAPPGPFRLGAIEGATPGKWIDIWRERMPHNPLELAPLAVATQRAALVDREVDAALVRLPIDAEGLHVIPLYEEQPVVVMSADSSLSAADELDADDLAGEVLIRSADDVLGFDASGTVTPAFAAPATTEDAVATVATGVGIMVVPMSLARLHHRKDVTFRPLRGGPASTVALAWPADATTPLVETFVGIVRGRTANSSR